MSRVPLYTETAGLIAFRVSVLPWYVIPTRSAIRITYLGKYSYGVVGWQAPYVILNSLYVLIRQTSSTHSPSEPVPLVIATVNFSSVM